MVSTVSMTRGISASSRERFHRTLTSPTFTTRSTPMRVQRVMTATIYRRGLSPDLIRDELRHAD